MGRHAMATLISKKTFVPDTESTLAIAALPTILVGDITSWTFIHHKTRTSKTLAIIVFDVTYKTVYRK